tara:strand:+ start:2460 stop:3188 length:729 start_codon:yes stop_codon:yes gene_type:complete
MSSHLYNSRLGKVVWFVRRFGLSELFLKPLRCIFAPLVIPRLPKCKFNFNGRMLSLFYHAYNMTWVNERAVEIPIIRDYLNHCEPEHVLEIGNVLSHYGSVSHTILDKFERGQGIINEDILDFVSADKFKLIVSISTFEHIGFDDEVDGESGVKILHAIDASRNLLTENGRLVLTLPIGYNPSLDHMIMDNQIDCTRSFFICRKGKLQWEATSSDQAMECRYGSPFPYANAILVAEFLGSSE